MNERKEGRKKKRERKKERKKEERRGQEGERRTSYTDEYRTKNKCVKIVLLFLKLFSF